MSPIPGVRRYEEAIWLRALIRRIQSYDIVHIHNRPQWVAGLRRLGFRGAVVLHLQNDHLGHWDGSMLDQLAAQLQAVVVCSTYLGECFRPKSSALAAKTKLIFNGVNTQMFFPREDIREPKTIFFVGSFIPQKGVLLLVQAFERVLDADREVRLVIGGSVTFGVEKTTPYITQVHYLADSIRRKKSADIQFIGSLHHENELPSWFQKASVFTCPSLFQEPFGLVNAEAMACATPVVGTNRGGVPEVLGDSGLVVDPENTKEFAAMLSRLLGDAGERVRLGRAGYNRSREVFAWNIIAKNWLQTLLNLPAPEI